MAKKVPDVDGIKVIASNRRARHDYQIIDTYEAGIVLQGSEIKSIREGHVQLKDSFAHVRDGEMFLIGSYIGPYAFSRDGGHEPERSRKLLLQRRQIDRIASDLAEKGLTLIPLRLYLRKGKAKVELGLGRGKRTIDKRETIKQRDLDREMERSLRGRRS
ncbi:MAG TPA: SsrA-binding protein SmpB [Acidimicrobiia bacterium]|nr:SsrA-binding protein SmpB [Acidimicrobiia bacterium]